MVLIAHSEDYNIVVDINDSRALYKNDVHWHLEDVLAYFDYKGHTQVSESGTMYIEGC